MDREHHKRYGVKYRQLKPAVSDLSSPRGPAPGKNLLSGGDRTGWRLRTYTRAKLGRKQAAWGKEGFWKIEHLCSLRAAGSVSQTGGNVEAIELL